MRQKDKEQRKADLPGHGAGHLGLASQQGLLFLPGRLGESEYKLQETSQAASLVTTGGKERIRWMI